MERRVLHISVLFCALVGVQAGASTLITTAPDWNQPNNYVAAEPLLNNNDYPCWCSPTAGACLMGYWEDTMGAAGLTDGVAWPGPPAPSYPGTPGTHLQGMWNDGTVELGWYMDTGGFGPPPAGGGPFPPKAGMTPFANIAGGMGAYASAGWVDAAAGIAKTAYPGVMVGTDIIGVGGLTAAQMWANYCNEIDNSRPALVSFDQWVLTIPPSQNVPGFEGFGEIQPQWYQWDTISSEAHTTCGVGYIDLTLGFQNNGTDEWFVVQDNWASTVQYVAVPLGQEHVQNDYLYMIPEPATLTLISLAGLALLRRRRR